MAIHRMISEDEGAAAVKAHDPSVRAYTTADYYGVPEGQTFYVRSTHFGRVLRTGEHNYYHDSDFYAVVQLPDGTFREIEYGTTRFWTYLNRADVDATPAVQAAYAAYLAALAAERAALAAEQEAAVPRAGRCVQVTGGRKLPRGTVARVFWYGVDKYRTNQWAEYRRVGLELDSGDRVWLAAEHVTVTDAGTADCCTQNGA